MELYFFTRGVKDRVDAMINDLQAQTFLRTYQGKKVTSWMHVKPIQIWSVGFPEEELQTVLKMIDPGSNYLKSLNKYGNILRKLLHAKKIPPIDPKTIRRPIRKHFVQVWGIGIRDDLFDAKGEEML